MSEITNEQIGEIQHLLFLMPYAASIRRFNPTDETYAEYLVEYLAALRERLLGVSESQEKDLEELKQFREGFRGLEKFLVVLNNMVDDDK